MAIHSEKRLLGWEENIKKEKINFFIPERFDCKDVVFLLFKAV